MTFIDFPSFQFSFVWHYRRFRPVKQTQCRIGPIFQSRHCCSLVFGRKKKLLFLLAEQMQKLGQNKRVYS